MPLDFTNMQINGNAKVDSRARIISFPKDPTTQSGSSSDFVGAVWSKINIPQKSGVSISFVPQITADLNCYANVCYPEGFAFVFTTTPVDLTIGGSRSGIGYEGINNAVAFEYDFLQSVNRNDNKLPHFSVHSNLAGAISATSPTVCPVCNKPLPNIYVIIYLSLGSREKRIHQRRSSLYNSSVRGSSYCFLWSKQ
jgi:hypothetical protein